MLKFLKGKTTELTITLDRTNSIYSPGETIDITVEIQPKRDLQLQGAQVKLSCTGHYHYRTIETTTNEDGLSQEVSTHRWGKNEFFVATQDFLGETTLTGGSPQRYSFQMSLPTDALPSCSGKIMRIQWQVSVKLDCRLARDWHAEADLTVFSLAPGKEVQPREYGQSNESNEAQVALMLPGLETVVGQMLNGQLRILPHKNFTSAARVELICTELVTYDHGKRKQKSFTLKLPGKTQFIAGQKQSIPFQISIPQDGLLSLKAPFGSITWKIKGVLNRRLRKDTTVEVDFWVYSARM